ncbi:hypothetical protein [Brassicibacter mesophilus]|uniref:hypothetical protein n=1 Tax=Brassicibacter mesophilus TaxID=745119 RepID=UPI003D203BBB
MLNNSTLKQIEEKAGLKHLVSKDELNYNEYMQVVCTDEFQKIANETLSNLKRLDKDNWY